MRYGEERQGGEKTEEKRGMGSEQANNTEGLSSTLH